jgi:predicted RNA-binding protein YlxR (DUF448 family)
MKKIPLRKCLVTGQRLAKKDLIRIVKTPEGEIKVDPTGKMNGRGAYLSKDPEVIAKAKDHGYLARAFACPVPDEIFEELMKISQKQ